MNLPLISAIVVAGGSSRRMGFDKLWADLAGQPVFLHSLRTLQDCAEIGQIILVIPPSRESEFRSATETITKLSDIVTGGAERHFSVWAGLEKVGADFPLVAVHDAARPLLSSRDLQATIAAARSFGASSLAAPVTDTLKRADSQNCVTEAVDRAQLWAMQTPQIFAVERLRAAYRHVMDSGEIVTDEVSAVAKLGDRVKLIASQNPNFKITHPCDIALARMAIQLSPKN